MKVIFTDSFYESFEENVINAHLWYKFKFWEHKYYDLKRGIKNLRVYFKIVFNIHPYISDSTILSLTKISLERVLKYLERGQEIEETRLPKIENIKRSIELINHFLEDDYAERCGWVFNKENMFKESPESNKEAIKESHKLREKEWDEIFILLKEIRSWWD